MNNPMKKPAFLVKATYRLQVGDVDSFWELATRLAVEARLRPGNIFLTAAQDVLDPSTFHLIEGWESQADFDTHIASPEFQAILAEAMLLRQIDRFGAVFTVSDIKDLQMPTPIGIAVVGDQRTASRSDRSQTGNAQSEPHRSKPRRDIDIRSVRWRAS